MKKYHYVGPNFELWKESRGPTFKLLEESFGPAFET